MQDQKSPAKLSILAKFRNESESNPALWGFAWSSAFNVICMAFVIYSSGSIPFFFYLAVPSIPISFAFSFLIDCTLGPRNFLSHDKKGREYYGGVKDSILLFFIVGILLIIFLYGLPLLLFFVTVKRRTKNPKQTTYLSNLCLNSNLGKDAEFSNRIQRNKKPR